MCEAACNCLEATGLDMGAVDIRVQSNREGNRNSHRFIVCEINSAPALGQDGVVEYRKVIKKLIKIKTDENNI